MARNGNDTMKTVICIGDSNTYGYDPRSFLGGRYANPWPALLENELGCRVINLGENGREIPHMKYQIEAMDYWIEENADAGQTDLIFLVMLGSNDILNICDDHVATVGKRMSAYIEHLKDKYSSRVILICPPVISAFGPDLDCTCKQIFRLFKETASEKQIEFLDTNEWDIPIGYDGVHFTEEGHRIMSERLSEIL